MDKLFPETQQPISASKNPPHPFITSQKPAYFGVLGAFLIAFFYLGIRLILGQDSFVPIHDNLDVEIPWRAILANNPDPEKIMQIMNGLPTSFMVTRLNLIYLLFEFFEPFTAYILAEALVHGVAFAGTYYLLQQHFRKYLQGSKLLIGGVALCFGLLPFYTIYGLSIAGQPLLLACFLNLQNKQHITFSLLYISVFCFLSSFVLTGIFILAAAGIWFLWNTARNKKINFYFLTGLGLMVLCYCISEYKLLELMLLKKIPSHRDTWDLAQMSKPFGKALFASVLDFAFGQYHVASQHIFILICSICAVALAWFRRINSFLKPLLGILFILGILALFYGFWQWNFLIPLKEKVTLLKTFNLSRFYFLQPLLWYLLLAFTLGLLYLHFQSKKLLISVLVTQLLFTVSSNLQAENELRNILTLLAAKLTGKPNQVITYRRFASAGIFDQIKKEIGEPQANYRVVSLGILPAMAQLNGFYTLDSYQNNYPLRYKNAFREIIAPELAKSPKWRAYFDGWGSRCYLFAAETEQGFPENLDTGSLKHFSINTEALKRMGGNYVISAYKLENSPENGLKLVRKFRHAEALCPLYLYAVL